MGKGNKMVLMEKTKQGNKIEKPKHTSWAMNTSEKQFMAQRNRKGQEVQSCQTCES